MSKTVQFQTIQFSVSTVSMSKTVQFQTIQFSVSTVSMSKTVQFQTIQFSVSTVSMSKTFLLQKNPFCMSTQFSSISPIDTTLSGDTTTRVDLGAMVMKGYSTFPKALALQETQHQIV